VLRSILLVTAIVIASAGHAQVSGDPQTAAPVAYSATQLTAQDCNNDIANGSSRDGCPPISDQAPGDDRAVADDAPDYVPDYWDEAPVYDAAPAYLGISLIPDGYWGWPYYGYGYGYGFGWPYYGFGFGWPSYGYAYWGGAYWGGYWGGGSWHGHDHHGGGDHGDWGHHGGDHHGNYHGPYRYMGHGQYADQGAGNTGGHGGNGSPRAGAPTQTMTATNFSRPGSSPDHRSTFAAAPAGSARGSAPANQMSGSNRFAGRGVLPSASYYAAARGGVGANRATSAYADAAMANGRTATNYRGSANASYAYGRGNTVSNTRNANQAYRVTSMPSRGYALSANRDGAIARSSGNLAPQRYAGSRLSYPQQHYAPSNRAYSHASMPGYGARGPMPSYSSARGAMPSYARGGSGSAPHGGHAGDGAAHASGRSYSGNARGH
jgi:hypothetical protein